jgi:Cd2+/Zn2+-exporting ATPase
MRNTMTKKQQKMLKRIILSVILYVCAFLAPNGTWSEAILFLATYIIIAYDVILRAVKNIGHGQVFDENFLMAVASIGAMCLSAFSEAVAVMLFYQIGEWFQSYAVERSRRSISAMMDLRPDHANIERDGTLVQVDPYEISVGDRIVVQPGEKVPLDGIVTDGTSSLDTSALTGESVPRTIREGDQIYSGCINQSGLLKVQVTKEFDDSTVAKILELVENASDRKSKSEDFITKFARYYTPIVVFSALALALIPSLITGQWHTWVYRALTFLVISCPCALVISVPLSFFGGIGAASKHGILIKGSNYMETLSDVTRIVFDKTGTLTKGTFTVTDVQSDQYDRKTFLHLLALAESHSSHPIAKSILEANKEPIHESDVDSVEEIAGHGVKAVIAGHTYAVGNQKLMQQLGLNVPAGTGMGTMVYAAQDGRYIGYAEIAGTIKPDSKDAIQEMKAAGIAKTVMLTGDSQSVAEAVAANVGIDEVHAQLLPGDKVDCLESMMTNETEGTLAFVGDGINDAPVLTRADVGIAMGALGSDAAIEAADVVLMNDSLKDIPKAIHISKKTLKIARQNIVFAIGVKVLVLILGALGIAGMWAAVFADSGVACLCVLNAMWCLKA